MHGRDAAVVRGFARASSRMLVAPGPMKRDSMLSVQALKVHFRTGRGRLFGHRGTVHAVDGIDFDIPRGRTLGLVGESGSGKTTTALAVMRLVQITKGSIRIGTQEISTLTPSELRPIRRRLQMVFQDPYSSLNPRERAGAIVRAPLDVMRIGTPTERESVVEEIFEAVGLRPEQRALFPHQFSGGQRQRINIARALATRPELVVCDEPVSALDVAIRAQILNLLRDLQAGRGLTYLFISHDMAVIEHMCDDIAVMYLGQIVERASRDRFFGRPLHPYSVALMSAVPSVSHGSAGAARRIRLAGDPPSPIDIPPGCRFSKRCPTATDLCRREEPALRRLSDSQWVRCHHVADATHGPLG
jgi:peptide/nickel transport system ATP-binding protein